MRVLLTTTSYQDTPGDHHRVLADSGFDIVRDRGPLTEARMLELIEQHGGFDGFLNGDDLITPKVIDAGLAAPTPLKVIGKYGIGLDSIDVAYATEKNLPVLFTPGVNHTTVAEHTFGLMIAASKHFWLHMNAVKQGQWQRKTGVELAGKTLVVLGLGRVGREVCTRAKAFGMQVVGHTRTWDAVFAEAHGVERAASAVDALRRADVVCLTMPATQETRGLINAKTLEGMKDGVIVVNTSRGALVVDQDIVEACQSGKMYAYATDVLDPEPPVTPHVFEGVDNILVTPHVGSRTVESVGRQAMRATINLIEFLNGGDDYIQVNPFEKS